MYKRLYDFLIDNKILYEKQLGFRKSHSTSLALIEVIDKISGALDDGNYTLGIFLDLSKAFDTLDHEKLLAKLQHHGIRGVALDWFRSYLSDRHQQVHFAGSFSGLAPILCGVPQGSNLGPLLFLVYINDVINCSSKLNLILFADDTSAFLVGMNFMDLFNCMNQELEQLSMWLHVNLLSLNVKKSNYVLFKTRSKRVLESSIPIIRIDNTELCRATNVKFLGVIINENLSWHMHIELVTNKVSKVIGIISKVKWLLPASTLKLLYTGLVLPYLNYCNVVWAGGYRTKLKPLLLLQKRAVRVICGVHYLTKSASLFKSLKLLTMTFISSSLDFLCSNIMSGRFQLYLLITLLRMLLCITIILDTNIVTGLRSVGLI